MNIDKSIEILEKKKKSLNLHIDNYYKKDCETAICRELVKERDAIENVLEEFERLEKLSFDVQLLTKDLENKRQENHELHDENIKLQMERDKLKEELEKYKNVTYFEKLEDGKLYEIDKERADDLYEHGNGSWLYIQMWKRKED